MVRLALRFSMGDAAWSSSVCCRAFGESCFPDFLRASITPIRRNDDKKQKISYSVEFIGFESPTRSSDRPRPFSEFCQNWQRILPRKPLIRRILLWIEIC